MQSVQDGGHYPDSDIYAFDIKELLTCTKMFDLIYTEKRSLPLQD